MKRNVLAVMIALFAGSAFATGIGNSYGGEGGKGGVATATGGNSAATGGNATGGSVLGSGNSSSSSGVIGSGNSANLNSNVQGQQQGQAQGQIATGGQGGSASAGSSSNSGGNTMIGGSQSSRTDNQNQSAASNSVTVEGDSYHAARNAVATAYAPGVQPTALCALGLSGGAQGLTFGLSVGTSYIDENCQKLEQVRATATVLGDRVTAAEMMCDVPSYKAARELLGRPCGGVKAAASTTPANSEIAAKKAAVGYQGNDEIVLRRLNIVPAK